MAKHKKQAEATAVVVGGKANRVRIKKKPLLIIVGSLLVIAAAFFIFNGPNRSNNIKNSAPTKSVNSDMQKNEANAYVDNVSKETAKGANTVSTSDGKLLPKANTVNYDQAINLANGLADNKNDVDLAITYYERALELAPAASTDINISIGQLLEDNGRLQESKEYYAAALKASSDSHTKAWLSEKVK